MNRRLLGTITAVFASLCVLWSLATPWAAAFPNRPDHYKVTLFGIRHIADMTAAATKTTCSWNDPDPDCRPANGGLQSYASLARARWFVFASLVLIVAGIVARRRPVWVQRTMPFVFAALCVGYAILLVRNNVASAFAAFAGTRILMSGSGMNAAIVATMLCLTTAILAALSASSRRLSSRHITAGAALFMLAGPKSLAAQPPGSPNSSDIRRENGQSCPEGTTEIRPRICRAPQVPAPSILDYRPHSTLVTPSHVVSRAKYPAIDFHGHPQALITSDSGLRQLGSMLDSINVRLMVAADNLSGERLQRAIALIRAHPTMRDRIRILAGIDFRNVGPGWAANAIRQLDADIAAGAVGVGEIPKFFGLSLKKPDSTRLRIDDPALDPIWDECARLGIPVFIHTADPEEFFRPIDYANERWLELSLFPGRRYPPEQFPSFDELMKERDNLFRRHPRTTFVAAHMGWHANDLGRLGKLLDDFPNVYTEVGAVLYDIGRQPHAAHDFFVKYQDRILFGKDSFQPEEYPYYWRVFETRDEYFDYYRHYHAFWKLYGIDLPDTVLKKIYYLNALRITRRLPRAGWQ